MNRHVPQRARAEVEQPAPLERVRPRRVRPLRRAAEVDSDLHILLDNTSPDVRNLVVLPVAKHVPEPVASEPCAGVHRHPIAERRTAVDRDARIHSHVGPDDRTGPDDDVCVDPTAVTNGGTVTDHGVRPDRHVAA